jgi:accessory cholera enterotoxin
MDAFFTSVNAFFSSVNQFFTKVIDFFNESLDFIYTGIYDFLTEWTAYAIIKSTIAYIDFKIFIIRFAWDRAKQILQQLNLSNAINNAFSSLDGNVFTVLSFLHVPETINLILMALVTKFVLRFLGF